MSETLDTGRIPARAPARIGLIGAGGIGRAHAQAVSELDGAGCGGATLVAVADLDARAASAVASQHGAAVIGAAELAADPDQVDLVVVAAPPATHPELVEPLLRAGIPVLCEKPLATTTAAAARLAELAQQTGTPLSMAAKFRFVDDIAAAHWLIGTGGLGELLKIEVSFASRVEMSGRWNADPAVSGGGVLIDNATHGVDLVRHLAGPISEVLVAVGPAGQRVEVEDSATLLARTEDGVLAQVDVTWSFRRLGSTYLAVYGSRGTVEVGWQGGRACTIGRPEPYDFGTGYRKIESLRANLAAVLAALAAGNPPPVSATDAVWAAAVIDAGYRSAREGGWEKVEMP